MTKHFLLTSFFIICILLIQPRLSFGQSELKVGGYLQTWFIGNQHTESINENGLLSENNVQGLRLRRARLTARGSINDLLSVTTWVNVASKTPSLLDFYVTVDISKALLLKIGQSAMPGKMYDASRNVSSKMRYFQRAEVSKKSGDLMGYDALRDVGVSATGQIGKLWYGVNAGNGLGRFQYAGSSFTSRNFGSGLYAARLDYELFEGVEIGGHFSTNQQRNLVQNGSDPFDINRNSYSLRAYAENLPVPKFFAQAEYTFLTAKDNNWGIRTNADGKYTLSGFYAEAGYHFNRRWSLVGRYDEMTEKPAQDLTSPESISNHYTFGISRFIFNKEDAEIARFHFDYSFGKSSPLDLKDSILVLVFQVRFIPG